MDHAAHRKHRAGSTGRRTLALTAGLGAGALVFAACGAVGSPTSAPPVNGGTASIGGAATTTTTLPPLQPVTASLTSTQVSTSGAITVKFSQPLAPGAPKPTLSPPVAGSWSVSGSTMTFTPSGGWLPATTEKVVVPAGVPATEHGRTVTLASTYSTSFTVGTGSELRLQEMLAELNYLPVSFTPSTAASSSSTSTSSTSSSTTTATSTPPTTASTTPPSGGLQPSSTAALSAEATVANAVRTSAVAGTFAWRFANTPASLVSQWSAGTANVITKGAVMAFEAEHNMIVDGIAGTNVWAALTQAIAARQVDPQPYNYLMVNESGTEQLQVWSDGNVVLTTPVNTGVPGAATPPGTYPVYLRYQNQIMRGTDVNGTKYAVPVSWISYFYGGDAVHGYQRASYGFPQSNGCVELPIATAKTLWTSPQGYDEYGVLVHVTAGAVGT